MVCGESKFEISPIVFAAATDIGYRVRRFENIYDLPSSPDCFNSDFLL